MRAPLPPPPAQFSTTRQIAPINTTVTQGGRAGDTPFPRPQSPMRPTTFPSKPPAEEPKFRYHAPIESSTKTNDLADRALDAQITISTRELLAASPDVRRHVKDAVTTKKVSANSVEVDEMDNFLTSCFNFDDDDERDRDSDTTAAAYLDLTNYDPRASPQQHPSPSASFVYLSQRH